MGYNKKIVGAEIRKRRLALGLTQEQAAEKIDRALRFYARVGLGDVGMSGDTLLEIYVMLKTPRIRFYRSKRITTMQRILICSLSRCPIVPHSTKQPSLNWGGYTCAH